MINGPEKTRDQRYERYAFTIGEIAYHTGLDLCDNVYTIDTPSYLEWENGWLHAARVTEGAERFYDEEEPWKPPTNSELFDLLEGP